MLLERIEKNIEILEEKKNKHKLSLDKKYLKNEKNLIKINKENEFIIDEAKVKNNINVLILKAGKKIAKMCILLTFISCLLTIGGNIDTFVFNIPLVDGEVKNDFVLTRTIVKETKQISSSVSKDFVQVFRLNIITSLVYIPFILALQIILYQISINLYNIKTRFHRYYNHAILLQYLMLFYSVYSNYKFLEYYTNPSGIIDVIMILIPSVLLDVSCIFFLSLSQDKKSLNYHTKTDLNNIKKFRLKNKEMSIPENIERVEEGRKKTGENKDESLVENESENKDESLVKNESENKDENINKTKGKFKPKLPTGNVNNRNINSDLKKVENYIKKLVEKGIEKIKVIELKKTCKIDKNKWAAIRKVLIKKGIIYLSENKRNTFIKNINGGF